MKDLHAALTYLSWMGEGVLSGSVVMNSKVERLINKYIIYLHRPFILDTDTFHMTWIIYSWYIVLVGHAFFFLPACNQLSFSYFGGGPNVYKNTGHIGFYSMKVSNGFHIKRFLSFFFFSLRQYSIIRHRHVINKFFCSHLTHFMYVYMIFVVCPMKRDLVIFICSVIF
jgi:hypothetical protein